MTTGHVGGPGPGKTPATGRVTPGPARRAQSDADQDEAREAMLEAEAAAEIMARHDGAG